MKIVKIYKGGTMEEVQAHWCRVEKCVHHGSRMGEDKDGRYWDCLVEVIINRDGKCEDMEEIDSTTEPPLGIACCVKCGSPMLAKFGDVRGMCSNEDCDYVFDIKDYKARR
jgi:hypothetical protein